MCKAQVEDRKESGTEPKATKKQCLCLEHPLSFSAPWGPKHIVWGTPTRCHHSLGLAGCVPPAGTHSCVSPALVAVSAQPFQGSLHLKLHILSGESVPCHGEATNGLGCHFHDNWVIRGEEVPKIISKSPDSGGIPTFHSYEAGWKRERQKVRMNTCGPGKCAALKGKLAAPLPFILSTHCKVQTVSNADTFHFNQQIWYLYKEICIKQNALILVYIICFLKKRNWHWKLNRRLDDASGSWKLPAFCSLSQLYFSIHEPYGRYYSTEKSEPAKSYMRWKESWLLVSALAHCLAQKSCFMVLRLHIWKYLLCLRARTIAIINT